jgi:hypothetical protein
MNDQNHHDAVRTELKKLTKRGVLKAEDVVEHARNPKTALHRHFEWDDTEAARQYRLDQARRLIRVFVVVEPARGESAVRAFVSLSTDRRKDGGGYRPIADVVADKDLYRQLLDDAIRELQGMQSKYQRIRELDPVFKAAQEVADQRQLKLAS